ncbi:MAG: UDP-N-acetylmuramate dehydrogenase [Stagnimonas sp.]|nr:UDP-N-acetylmuramate dehydrogenase [Stagnimonas sp.]
MNVRGSIKHNELLSRHTSWRVGGPARTFFEPADREDLITFVRALPAEEPLLWLGLGSNLLVRDGGFAGTVIHLHGALGALRLGTGDGVQGTGQDAVPAVQTIYAEAGTHCARLAKFAKDGKLAGLGFMAGIPGTVGGALAMNAGAWGGETWPQVSEAEIIRRDGGTEWLPAGDFRFAYREVEVPQRAIGFIAARFNVTPDADGSHERYTRESLAKRKATQPVGKPSAGSTFRNPVGDHAARLIESCGLKGHRIGGATVSVQHANFVLTEDGACAADVEQLIAHLQATVKAKTGIALHAEVKIVGDAA